MTYDLNGERHWIDAEEVEAIERSGKPHRAQDYAEGHNASGYFDITQDLMSVSIRLMDQRTGQTTVGGSPAVDIDKLLKMHVIDRSRPIHLKGYKCSGPRGNGIRRELSAGMMSEVAYIRPRSLCANCAKKLKAFTPPRAW